MSAFNNDSDAAQQRYALQRVRDTSVAFHATVIVSNTH